MAIAPTELDRGTGTANDKVTASITFVAGRMYFVAIAARLSATPDDDSWSVSGASQTFTRVAERVQDAGGDVRDLAVFRCAPSSGSSGALTLHWGGAQSIVSLAYQVLEEDEALTTGTNGSNGITDVVEAQGSGSPASVTITGTPATGDVTMAFCTTEDDAGGATFEANYTAVAARLDGIDNDLIVGYSASQDQTPSLTWTQPPNSKGWSIIAFILKAAGGTTQNLSGSACTGGVGSQSPGHSIGL